MSRKTLSKLSFFIIALAVHFHGNAAGVSIERDFNKDPAIIANRAAAQTQIQLLTSTWVEEGGLELITGGPSSAKTQSRWGHTSLRFVGSGRTSIEDIVVEAMAFNPPEDGGNKVIWKGLTGGYPISLIFGSLGNLIRSYYFNETRGYSRIALSTTPALRKALIQTLSGANQARSENDRYYFFANNCTTYIAWLLDSSGMTQLPAPTPFIPTRAALHLRKSFLSPWPEIQALPSVDLKRFSTDTDSNSWATTPTLELQRMIVFGSRAMAKRTSSVIEELQKRKDKGTAEQVYGITPLPAAFYQREQNLNVEVTFKIILENFSQAELSEAALYNRGAWMTTYTTAFCNESFHQCSYFNSGRQLVEAAASGQ